MSIMTGSATMHKFILVSKALEVIVVYAHNKLEAYQQAREMGYEV